MIFVLTGLAFAAGTTRAQSPMVYSSQGAAISGYDPVAYFTLGKPVRGQPQFALVWKKAEWWFASRRNRDLFEANPRAYAPQYGGYCAYAMSTGTLSSTEPDAWLIRDGRLYLVHNQRVFRVWSQDIPGYVVRANAHWPSVLRK